MYIDEFLITPPISGFIILSHVKYMLWRIFFRRVLWLFERYISVIIYWRRLIWIAIHFSTRDSKSSHFHLNNSRRFFTNTLNINSDKFTNKLSWHMQKDTWRNWFHIINENFLNGLVFTEKKVLFFIRVYMHLNIILNVEVSFLGSKKLIQFIFFKR